MNRGIIFLSAIILTFGAQSLFAQYELPEPVFIEPAVRTEAEIAPVSGVVLENSGPLFANFNEVVYFLWDSDPADQSEPTVFLPIAALAAAASTDAEQQSIPQGIRNNRYYLESERLKGLADQSFEDGDYDSSTNYATESVRYAQLSDEYVVLQLKIKETNDAIAAAKTRLDWAASSGAAGKYPA
ncbi:MAG: hypothetical protein LBN21_07315, partial [Treponema sp.]|nr:hypothetical protein [Treponema sp.]